MQSTQPVSQLMAHSHHMWPVKQLMIQPDHKKSLPVNNPTQVTTIIPKMGTKPPVKLDFLSNLCYYRIYACIELCKTDFQLTMHYDTS